MLRKGQGVGKPPEIMWYLRAIGVATVTSPKPEGIRREGSS